MINTSDQRRGKMSKCKALIYNAAARLLNGIWCHLLVIRQHLTTRNNL